MSEIEPDLFLGNAKKAENIPPPSDFEYQRGSQGRSYAAMPGIESDFSLGNAKNAENIPPAPSALEYYRQSSNLQLAVLKRRKTDHYPLLLKSERKPLSRKFLELLRPNLTRNKWH